MEIRFSRLFDSRLSKLCALSWLVLAVVFTLEPLSSAVSVVGVTSIGLAVLLAITSPMRATYLLPFFVLLGPIIIFRLPGIGSVNGGDIVSLALLFSITVISKAKLTITLSPIFFTFILLFLGSVIFSPEIGSAFVGFIKTAQFIILAWLTSQFIVTDQQRMYLLLSWMLASSIGALMMLCFWLKLDNNFLVSWAAGVESVVTSESAVGILFRPTYFYTNFGLPLALSSVFAAWMITSTAINSNRGLKSVLVFCLIIFMVCLALNNTRAYLLPTAFLVSAILLMYLFKFFKVTTYSIILIVFLSSAFVYDFDSIDNETPSLQSALIERSMETGSVGVRRSVWTNAISIQTENLFRFFLVGYGPQSTFRQDSDLMIEMRTHSGGTEGSLDSAILGFITDYGLALTVLIICYVFWWMSGMAVSRDKSTREFCNLYVMFGLIVIFSSIFQQFGTNGAGLIALQLLCFRWGKGTFAVSGRMNNFNTGAIN